jgi:hypothetical protein
MKTFTVIIEKNESSNEIGTYETLEKAKSIALEYLEDTNPENDSEGINIYTEDGMVMSFSKGQEPIEINPKTGMCI